ncbi:YbaK/EbsC family protein [Candidatus Formimonas warabiya]|uniref:EBSC protein n=1 Tax=Formimonas warabiya TaxID=1761012 RepID=A0A3G1KYE4_FORW1|nr:YbaK/EbsC family protein [Candidatus Formimonas warabiya]ATW27472.1 EBSC protein [Candidatus Formimonas warabiya]
MAIEKVRAHLKKWGRSEDILEFEASSATVDLAAQALGVEPARIAKTISFRFQAGALLVVAAGDAKIDSAKFKREFGFKAKMLTPDEVPAYIGHAIGGVCPFGLNEDTPVFLDVSLQRFKTVFPACGSSNSAIELTCDELNEYSLNKKWVDVCKGWEEE